jgi:hypothetical protein
MTNILQLATCWNVNTLTVLNVQIGLEYLLLSMTTTVSFSLLIMACSKFALFSIAG